jgi:hypothetical protein
MPKDTCRFWLIPAHVPSHWTLVVLDWVEKRIFFMDSLNAREGADRDESRVKEEVVEFLKLVEKGSDDREWSWNSEKVSLRHFSHNLIATRFSYLFLSLIPKTA